MKFTEIFLTILCILQINFLYSQDFECLNYPVKENGHILSYPFSGGYDAPQFNQMDIDLDSHEDLIIFDRATKEIKVLLYSSEGYVVDCYYHTIFPPVSSWIRIIDYDQDGIKDLFISPYEASKPSIEVWKGAIRDGKLNFEQIFFPYGNEDVISYYYFGNYYGVYVAKPDIPAIIDIDKDGDLDVLAFESGGGTINFYKNLCIEQNLSLDSFKMELSDRCWGKFRESLYNEDIILSEDPTDCASSSGFRHAGSTLNIFDMDNDEDYDLLLGDSEYPGLIYLQNEGGEVDWMTYQERDFPQNDIPISMNWFLGSFLIDLDLDGQEELMIAPNTTVGEKNKSNIIVYKDFDNGEGYDFTFEGEMLSNESIDWGSKVYPSFVDYNLDGLIDVVIGTQGYYDENGDYISSLILYENIGSPEQPSYLLVDKNFASTLDWDKNALCPTFGDLDDDGDLDMIIGMGDGSISYLKNIASPGETFEFDEPIFDFMNIDVGYDALPFLFDINEDNKLDILCGNEKSYSVNSDIGSLALFVNTGSKSDAFYHSEWDHSNNQIPWGGIALHQSNFNLKSNVRPWIYKTNNKTLLFVGSISGNIGHYEIKESLPQLISETFGPFNFDEFATPTFSDIDNDNYLEMLVGVESGGLKFNNTPIDLSTTDLPKIIDGKMDINFHPNPANNYLEITINDASVLSPFSVSILNDLGQIILKKHDVKNNDSIQLKNLQPGLYFIHFKNVKGSKIEKLIIH